MIMWNTTKYVWTHGSIFSKSTFNLEYSHHFTLRMIVLKE